MAPNKTLVAQTCKYVASCGVLVLIASCSGKHNSQNATQVAAKVGGYEITNSEVNSAVSRLANVPQDQIATVRANALESIVKEQLLIQQAQAEKVDRQPQVVAAIEEARRSIIARAYAAQITESQLKPSEEDTHQYYQQHPELFSARKIYNVKEITTPVTPEISEYLRDFPTSGKSLEQLGQWLQGKKMPFKANAGDRDPESLPLSFLPQLAAAKDGSTVVLNNGAVFYVAQILNSRPAPITEESASPSIRRFLSAQRSKAAIDREIAQLRANTKIQYEGEFAKTTPNPVAEIEQGPSVTEQNLPSSSSTSASN